MQRTDIERAARLAGLELSPDTDVTITGSDPVLPTPLHLGEGAAAALALLGQEADRLWRMRGGRRQSTAVDVRHAAASLRSYALLRLNHEALAVQRPVHPLTAIWRCRDDRHIQLHSSFTHTAGTLAELGLDGAATGEQIGSATRERDAFELEDALAAQGLCAAVCRTTAEWAAHPQGILLAGKPVVEVTKIGDTPPQSLPEGDRPLSGVRVLDLTRVLAGPTVARTLAEHGADVLHIAARHLPTFEMFEMDTGHGKRQAYIDLNDAGQADTLRDLVRGADVFSQGFSSGHSIGAAWGRRRWPSCARASSTSPKTRLATRGHGEGVRDGSNWRRRRRALRSCRAAIGRGSRRQQ